ncbi:hypothetical protein GCM10027589_36060 [Actinocorallia lasiicapitis]
MDVANLTLPRHATPADIPSLVALRRVLLTAMHGADVPDDWERPYAEMLATRLDDADFTALVVDGPTGPVACGIGVIERLLPGPGNPAGLRGQLLGMATLPDSRGQGHARLIVTSLLAWFQTRGVPRIDLNATPAGAHLYRSFGFTPSPYPVLTWRAPSPTPHHPPTP